MNNMNTTNVPTECKAIPNLELAEKAQSALSKLCSTGGKSFTMTVPPRLDDTDLIFRELITRFELLSLGCKLDIPISQKQVPYEWFGELVAINNKVIEASTEPIDKEQWSFFIGCLQSHIYNYKYFNQPEQSSELEEFAKWVHTEVDHVYTDTDGWEMRDSIDYNKWLKITFSEVYKAFQNREK